MDAVHQTDADNDRSQTEELSTANVLAEDGDCQKDGQNRRHAAERAGDIRAHQPIGFKIQQRSGSWKQQSNAANRTTALASPPLGSTKNGARHQKSSVEV